MYNDPEKNGAIPQFKIEITEPGKTDWTFDLEVQGKQPVASPGPKAISFIQ